MRRRNRSKLRWSCGIAVVIESKRLRVIRYVQFEVFLLQGTRVAGQHFGMVATE